MKDWQQVLVTADATIGAAVGVLDRGALRIVLVVDGTRRLLGTVTDGDVRRGMLRRTSIDAPVSTIMCAMPTVAAPGTPRAECLAIMERGHLLHLPIVDENGTLAGLETLDGLLRPPRRDNPVFLMAGGFGTRLLPMTENVPKPLLKVGRKPLLEHILDSLVAQGFHRFFISLHYMPEMIQAHFGDGRRWGVDIRYVQEDVPLGTAGALGLLPHAEIDAPLLMLNGDLLTTVDYGELLEFHMTHGGAATLCVSRYEHRVPYGVVVSDDHVVRSIEEKPAHAWLINAGIYVLSPEVVHRVPAAQRIDMPELISDEIARGGSVNAFPLREYWLDIGRMAEFEKAQQDVGALFGDR
jgi:dTDP-glucose pyrophosphorylase